MENKKKKILSNDMNENWKFHSEYFSDPQSDRNIYVEETDLNDWKNLFELIKSNSKWQVKTGDETNVLPAVEQSIFKRKSTDIFYFHFKISKNITIDGWTKQIGRFDLSYYPSNLQGSEEMGVLFDFIKALGDAVQKKVLLVGNIESDARFEYDPKSKNFCYFDGDIS